EFIDAATRGTVRTSRFERALGEPFALVDDIAGDAGDFLKHEVGVADRVREWRLGTRNVRAWQLVSSVRDYETQSIQRVVQGDSVGTRAVLLHADSVFVQAQQADPQWIDPLILRSRIAFRLGFAEALSS